MNAEILQLHSIETDGFAAMLEAVPGGFILLDYDFAACAFNEASQEFFAGSYTLYAGMEFDTIKGMLLDMTDENGFGEVELLSAQLSSYEECTVDYRRYDGKWFRINAKPVSGSGCTASLHIMDVSDITEAERLMANRGHRLVSERNMLISRLKLVDAIVSEREAGRLRAEYYVRLTRLLDRIEDTLNTGDIDLCRLEIKRQREYIKTPHSPEKKESFVKKLKNSLGHNSEDMKPRVVFHHISAPKCGDLLENDIIEAAREGVILITVCGLAEEISLSLRGYEGGAELCIHSDEPVVSDYQTSESYLRLMKIVKRMKADLETDISNGFDLKLRCSISVKDEAIRRYKLTEVEQNIIKLIGQGMSSEKTASALHYSQGSLRNMLSAIYVKLGINDKAQLTAFAILNGFSDSFNA